MIQLRKGPAGDLALAGLLLALCLGTAPMLSTWSPDSRAVGVPGVVLLTIAPLSIALRRRWPLATLGISTVCTATYLVLNHPYGPIMFCVAVASYSVARRVALRSASVAAAGAVVLLLLHLITNDAALPGMVGVGPAAAWVAVPFSIGVARRLVVEAAERQRIESERQKVDAERLRLASEVHDIVGHGLAAIQMQADIALHVAERQPGQAEVALTAISRTSAEALAELRATLQAIAPPARSHDPDHRAPTPGLDRVADLCDRIRTAGVEIDLDVLGRRVRVPSAVDVAAYRVVQESLTNVVRHGDDRRAAVQIVHAPTSVEVEITNRIEGLAGDEGFGIAGMRRRVAGAGGAIAIERVAGTFRVRATFPL